MATAKAEEVPLPESETEPDSPELCELVSELDVASPPVVVVVMVELLAFHSISICPADNIARPNAYIVVIQARRSTCRLASSVGAALTSLRTRVGVGIRDRSGIGRVVSGSLITHQPFCNAPESYAFYSQKSLQHQSMQRT